MNINRKVRRISLLTTLGVFLMAMFAVTPSQGAVPQLDTIRVALFLNYPGKYTANTPAATFQSADKLNIGVRLPSGTDNWFAAQGGTPVRFSNDDYKVKVAETTDFNVAVAAFKRVKAASGTGFIYSSWKNNAPVYQVLEGVYTTAEAGTTALARWSGDAELLKQNGGFKPALQGPLHFKSGSYASEVAAETAAKAFGNAGVDAYVAVQKPAGAVSYTVLVGAAADQAGLAAVQAQAAAAGSLQPVAAGDFYMLKRADYTSTINASEPVDAYIFPSNDMKVWVSPAGGGATQLVERYNRSYRGDFEISVFNDRLAVVNELPFEQYLYAVVGSEMYASWPAEALKAQAVAARTYALYQGFGFQIAHVVDSVLSEAYGGIGAETNSTRAAVDATAGEVLMYQGKLIEALFSSNGGGQTSDASEVWGNAVPYLKSVNSPWDSIAEQGLKKWYRVALPNGTSGYVIEDQLADTGEVNPVGKPIMEVTSSGATVRKLPLQDSTAPVASLTAGSTVVAVDKTVQSNTMNWVRGPFTSSELLGTMKNYITGLPSSITSLEVTSRGASGRVLAMQANGAPLTIKSPDSFRSALGSLPSTKFTVDETAKMALRGAGSVSVTRTGNASPLYMIGSDGTAKPLASANVYVLNGSGQLRTATKDTAFRFTGTGNGHGIGLSQYGAYGLAEQGYDYQYILQYYYTDVNIVKE
ncbi:SpoIID/LytB domain-containing protein [Paenibacillus protaetiae]|uniref:SpoIID/LytB domain-containing protein n=1 Tax=Paenibacillus protaetiae TaxID=2509456 RepID=A0A4P6EQE4_9BACL|nr:SpoIID/LytB domain-containing protein [Paenibacillus protaetiae]QAY65180.1 SpoIID/LytB domain-containing protein [Paenibacillus protaetiae]